LVPFDLEDALAFCQIAARKENKLSVPHMKTGIPFLIGLKVLISCAVTTFSAQVTFQVNMSAQVALGNFNPASDVVLVAGDPLNSWSETDSPLAPSLGDTNIWVGTFEVTGTAGNTAQYKFLIATASATTWEGNVGSGGTTGNRTFTVADTDQTLPVAYFNNVTGGTSVSADVTFRVNLSVQVEQGTFDPVSGTVSVAGEFNSWSTTAFELAQSASEPNLWVGTLKLSGSPESSVSYKFVMNGGSWEGNVGPNGAQNRSLTLSQTAQILPIVFFDNVTAVPKNIPITFQVNLGVLIAQGGFDPDTGTVSVAGDPLNAWDTAASLLTRSVTDPNLWTGMFDVNSWTGAVLLFKYVLNGSTWEGNVGPDGTQNRSYTLASTDPQTLPIAYFDNVNHLGALSLSAIVGGQLTLSWTAGPQIRLQTAADLANPVWQDVPNTLGQGSVTVPMGTGRGFYQLVGP
jgi:hypothetical protein